MILGRILERAASVPPPEPPPLGVPASGSSLVWWSRPEDGAFNVVDVGHAGVLTYPAAGRCVSLIADSLAGVPLKVFRGTEEITPTPTWIADPGGAYVAPAGGGPGSLTPFDFWSQVFVSLLLHGNAYAWLDRGRAFDGAPTVPIHVLNPALVTVEAIGDSVAWYTVGDVKIEPPDMLHIRGRTLAGSAVGMGVVEQYRLELAAMGALRAYAGGTFTASGVPAGILKSEAPDLTQAEADALKAKWQAAHGGTTRSVAVLNATTTFTPLSLKPEDAQFLETRRLTLLDIANMFGVPPAFVGAPTGDSLTYNTIEGRFIELGRFTLLPWARRVENALYRYLPRGQQARFVLDGLYRADTKTRYEAHKVGLEAGFLTVDEVRDMENRPPMPEEPKAEVPPELVANQFEPAQEPPAEQEVTP